jgi:hypothetical protein
VKWHTPPDTLVQSDWEETSKANRKLAAKTKGVAILPLSDLDWQTEMPLNKLFDTVAAASSWMKSAGRIATNFFADPLIHDGTVATYNARGMMKFPRPSQTRGMSTFKSMVKRQVSPRAAKLRGGKATKKQRALRPKIGNVGTAQRRGMPPQFVGIQNKTMAQPVFDVPTLAAFQQAQQTFLNENINTINSRIKSFNSINNSNEQVREIQDVSSLNLLLYRYPKA